MAYIMNMTPDRFTLEAVLKENYLDTNSFVVSDKFLNSLTESQKIGLADKVGSIAMKKSEKRLQALNKKGAFLDLPQTRGNITKSKAYKITKKCLSVLKPMLEKAKGKNTVEAVTAFHIVETAMNNLEKNIKYFEKAYDTNDSVNILLYQTVSLAVMDATSIVFINCISITEDNLLIYRDPPTNSLKKNILFKNLEKFNDLCRNNKLTLNETFERKVEEYEMVYNEAVPEGASLVGALGQIITAGAGAHPVLAATAGIALVGTAIIAAIYLIRVFICWFYFKKNDIAESLKYLSMTMEADAVALSNSKHDQAVAKRKLKAADTVKKLAKALDDDVRQTEHQTITTLKQEDISTSNSLESNYNPDNRQDVVPKYDATSNPGDDLFI